ncbi:Serine/threonine-protein kinase Sgk1 [Xenoophorus captivus]|uniref:Serine/threonine-protein kinase Sgk1 n=1 Tax=Xenoophorus captivus TaxID=1517983 RepID=A0ABV0S5L7_9TELE
MRIRMKLKMEVQCTYILGLPWQRTLSESLFISSSTFRNCNHILVKQVVIFFCLGVCFRIKPCDFDYLKIIGKGSFGKVLLARHRETTNYYAVKVLQKKMILKKKEQKHIMAERSVLMKNIKHPFLVGLHYSFQTTDKLYFVLDYVNGGELFYHLQRERIFLEPRARFYAAEIASALGYLHSLHIVYRDLKPENILLDSQGHIVLTDFGLCKEGLEPNGTTSTFCGTPEYLAPEVLQKQAYDRTVDWWCLGSVLYEMLYGLPPFYSRNTAEMYNNILHKAPVLKPNVSNSGRELLEGLLQKERSERLGAKDDFVSLFSFRSVQTSRAQKMVLEQNSGSVGCTAGPNYPTQPFQTKHVPSVEVLQDLKHLYTGSGAAAGDVWCEVPDVGESHQETMEF